MSDEEIKEFLDANEEEAKNSKEAFTKAITNLEKGL